MCIYSCYCVFVFQTFILVTPRKKVTQKILETSHINSQLRFVNNIPDLKG